MVTYWVYGKNSPRKIILIKSASIEQEKHHGKPLMKLNILVGFFAHRVTAASS